MNKLSVIVLSSFVIISIFMILVYLTFFLRNSGSLKAEPEELPKITEKNVYELPEIPDKK